MWIRPVFTIIPLNSLLIPQIGKFGIIFDTRPCEIDDLAVSSRQHIYPTLNIFQPRLLFLGTSSTSCFPHVDFANSPLPITFYSLILELLY